MKQKLRFRMRWENEFFICPEGLMPGMSLFQASQWRDVAGCCNGTERRLLPWPIVGRVSQ